MSYSNFYLKKGQRLLQTLGVLSLVSFILGLSVFVSELGKKTGWKHIEGLEHVYVVNRSSTGFDVLWSTTTTPVEKQWVEVGESKGSYPIQSKAEQTGGAYVSSITGLKPGSNYFFRIRSGASTYNLPILISEQVKLPHLSKEKPVSPAYGKVVLPSLKAYANEWIIYEIDGYYPLATLTKQTGEWLLPLSGLIDKKSNSIHSASDSTKVSIRLLSYPNGAITTTMGSTKPLKQTIVAGKQVRLAQSLVKKDESVLGVSDSSPITSTRIIYPKEGALIPGKSPLIRGTAPAGKNITVLIQGGKKQFSYRTQADERGDWLVQSPISMDFGTYTITVTIQSGVGATTIVKRSFTIIKSGEQVLGEATGSPTLAPTSPQAPPIAPTITPLPTYASTVPTEIIPTRFVPTATPPVTGGGMSVYLFGALVCIVVGAGLVLAF